MTGGTIDLDRCRRGMAQLLIEGNPRDSLIEAAIALIQADPGQALRERYLGIKNYASFGDQREDHSYGMGPRHGHIVFRIERSNEFRAAGKTLDGDAIYYLEAYRDFGAKSWTILSEPTKPKLLTLREAICELDYVTARRQGLINALAETVVGSHAGAAT